MSYQQQANDNNGVGRSPDQVDAEAASDNDVATALGMDVGDRDDRADDLDGLVQELASRDDVDKLVSSILRQLVDERNELRDRVDELEEQQESTHDVATTAVAKAQSNEVRVDKLEDSEEKTRDIAKSAIAKAEQVDSDPDQQEDAEKLPAGVEPSTSPLDFFANCRQTKIKTMFVEESNRQNTYRAMKVAKRWKEFANRRRDGSGVFWTKGDVDDALTAVLGGQPHRQTVARVWDKLAELGANDVREKTRQVGRKQDKKELLAMDMETAERLLEKRYIGMDLLEGGGDKAATGGVTPVVTGAQESAV